jgi:hypothetical protein
MAFTRGGSQPPLQFHNGKSCQKYKKKKSSRSNWFSVNYLAISAMGETDFAEIRSTRIITQFLMDLDTLRLRLIEKFIGYQLRWMNGSEWRILDENKKAPRRFSVSDHFPNEFFCGDALYIAAGPAAEAAKKALPFRRRIYLTGRICEIVASLDNHRSPKLILRVITR